MIKTYKNITENYLQSNLDPYKNITNIRTPRFINSSWAEDQDFKLITLRSQINDRKLSFHLNPQYFKVINRFSNELIIKYVDNLSRVKIVSAPQKTDKSLKIEVLYKDYIKFVSEFYNLVIEAKNQGKSKSKKFLILIQDFNKIVGHTKQWKTIFNRRTKKIQKLQRFGKKVVPTRRILIKLRFLIDKLFRWLYKLPKARHYFGKKIISKHLDYNPRTQILYRKKLKLNLGW